MKTKTLFFLSLLIAYAIMFNSCNKDEQIPAPEPTITPVDYYSGLGSKPGIPTGRPFVLPSHVKIIGDIRGGIMGKNNGIDKNKYTGPFPYITPDKTWIDYGTGTYVNLYIKFYNSLPTPSSVTIPGGLIFIDSLDINTHTGTYQKGYILQSVTIYLPALDTSFAHINAYCLNHTLLPSNYNAIYYIGPITNNPQLNQISSIMSTKQYPFGEEYNIQNIIWNVTDYGMTLTPSEIQYLNSLP